ncbi:MAG: cytochrome c [Myxococcales bacterium]|nr:cytochrome c [Myxococcales bacterium]HIM02328.1 cytochrome c [Myxococcales bacterium]
MRRYTFQLTILTWLTVWAVLRFGVQPPIPGSVMGLYLAITTVAILVYLIADPERLESFLAPIVSLLREERLAVPRIAVLWALPLLLGWMTFSGVRPQFDPPFEARTIHPEPPSSFKLHGDDFDVLTARRPPEMEVNEENLAAGRRIYFRNCMYCHGDYLDGKGHFAEALNPLPANFRDGGTISQLEEGYVYWRVATGGPGLPQGATPWNSSMPVWQDFLSEEEIWQVIAFIYDASGSTPRTWEEH